jgi:hypothetical protein
VISNRLRKLTLHPKVGQPFLAVPAKRITSDSLRKAVSHNGASTNPFLNNRVGGWLGSSVLCLSPIRLSLVSSPQPNTETAQNNENHRRYRIGSDLCRIGADRDFRSSGLPAFRHFSCCNRAVPRSTSTTAPITITLAIATFRVTASLAMSQPSNTATIGFTYVCVATSVGE